MDNVNWTVDWVDAAKEATEFFCNLLRIDTTNSPDHPGNETEAANLIADTFRRDGIDCQVLESAPGRGNVIARLRGNGDAPPILLSGHLDVVPAEAEHWEHPPFGGEIHDGAIWGRGAIDMKNMVAMEVMALLLLKRHGTRLSRDVIFAGVADEEAGCTHGSLWLAKNHPDLIRAEYAFSEVGGFTLHMNGQRFYPVQVAEKGVAWLTVHATGTPGHGSMPNSDNPITKIGRAAALLGTKKLPYKLTPVVQQFINRLAGHLGFPNSTVLKLLENGRLADILIDHVLPDKSVAATFDATLHNTASPTIISGGEKVNQVPSEATLAVDGRTLPGQSGSDLVRQVHNLIGTGYEITIDQELPPVVGDANDPVLGRIASVLHRHDPGGIVLPTLIPGFTDAKAYSRLGTRCIGFAPVQLPAEMSFAQMFHGHNERIPVDGFHWGMRVLAELVAELATESAGP